MSVEYDGAFLRDMEKTETKQFVAEEWPKLRQAAEVHGYRGASKKKHNGVVPIRPTDKGLLKTLERLRAKTNFAVPDGTLPIKAVAHVPSGNRLVGFRRTDGHIIILGRANYGD